MKPDSADKLSALTIALHWVIALGILSLIAVGLYMVNAEAWPLYDLHKSFGLLVFGLVLLRLLWRIRNGLPKPVRAMSRFEHLGAQAAHVLLLLGTIALPVTGVMFSAFSGYGFGIFGWQLLPERSDPAKPGQVLPLDQGWSDWGQNAHRLIGYLLLALIVLHVAAALKHHVLDRDATLTRMLGLRRSKVE